MPNSPVATPATPNKDLYNGGSEWQNDYSNLPDYYQTFNRNYDAAIARFVGVDPMAESAESMTSYQYAGNNPIAFNDPLGDKALACPACSGGGGGEFPEYGNNPYASNYGGLNGDGSGEGAGITGDINAGNASAGFGGIPNAFRSDFSSYWIGAIANAQAVAQIMNQNSSRANNSGPTNGTGNGGTGNYIGYDLTGNQQYFVSKNNGDNFNSYYLVTTSNEPGILDQSTLISYDQATSLRSGNGLGDDDQGGGGVLDWLSSHFYTSADYDVSIGPQLDVGLKNGAQVTIIPYAHIFSEGHADNRTPAYHNGLGEKSKTEFGGAYEFGIDFKNITDPTTDQDESQITVGALGFLGASLSWDPRTMSITHWNIGIDISLHAAIIVGGTGEIKFGLGIKRNKMQYILIGLVFFIVIILNIYQTKYLIKRALKRFVIPKLKEKGFTFKGYRWVGFFKFGDFKDEVITLRPSFTGGSPFLSIYVYIYYIDTDLEKRITVKIDTLFLFIKKVSYSSEL
jgi:RHS repeat-associated protein